MPIYCSERDCNTLKSNDIWSLGIILLNLATGRNPWKSATPNDSTFQAYLRDLIGFLAERSPYKIIVRILELDFLDRMTLREVRYAIQRVTSFYSDGVIFEGSMARCPWESGMDIDSVLPTQTLTSTHLTLLPFIRPTLKMSTHIWFPPGANLALPILYLPSILPAIHLTVHCGRHTCPMVQRGLLNRLFLPTLTMTHIA
jgi:serine/threonine protein kinase